MGTVYNIRGTNGSGKSTLARSFTGPPEFDALRGGPVELNRYCAPTKKDVNRMKVVPGYVSEHETLGRVGVLGRYSTACGGMDTLPDFETCQRGLYYLLDRQNCDHVIAEGILASTVYGSWGKWADAAGARGHVFAFCYLDTPWEVVQERIRKRQTAAGNADKKIKWTLVEDKMAAIRSTRLKAIEAGHPVYDLPYLTAREALLDIMQGKGQDYAA